MRLLSSAPCAGRAMGDAVMVADPDDRGATPPPSTRALRAQVVQRLQLGFFGLASILLLVGLADIVLQRPHPVTPAPGAAPKPAAAGVTGDTDPLANIGVAASPTAHPPPRKPASPHR